MREMVLNHASLGTSDPDTLMTKLIEMASGMVTLNQHRVTDYSLRMSMSIYEIPCGDDLTLLEAVLALQTLGKRDEYLYLMRLSEKTPILVTVSNSVKDRFLRCEVRGVDARRLSPEDGAPLLYCAITDGIAIGFPSNPIWDSDQIDVNFEELLPNDEFEHRIETIDNLTRSEHATTILERHRTHLRHSIANFEELWEQRESAFPNLVFGPDVEDQLQEVNPGDLSAIVKKLLDNRPNPPRDGKLPIQPCPNGMATSLQNRTAFGTIQL